MEDSMHGEGSSLLPHLWHYDYVVHDVLLRKTIWKYKPYLIWLQISAHLEQGVTADRKSTDSGEGIPIKDRRTLDIWCASQIRRNRVECSKQLPICYNIINIWYLGARARDREVLNGVCSLNDSSNKVEVNFQNNRVWTSKCLRVSWFDVLCKTKISIPVNRFFFVVGSFLLSFSQFNYIMCVLWCPKDTKWNKH